MIYTRKGEAENMNTTRSKKKKIMQQNKREIWLKSLKKIKKAKKKGQVRDSAGQYVGHLPRMWPA